MRALEHARSKTMRRRGEGGGVLDLVKSQSATELETLSTMGEVWRTVSSYLRSELRLERLCFRHTDWKVIVFTPVSAYALTRRFLIIATRTQY